MSQKMIPPNSINFKNFYNISLIAVVISILFSIWSVYCDNVINNDGILYIYSAESFLQHDLQKAFSFYKWPFYPLLIAIISRISTISLEYSAHILNAALTGLMVYCFIHLVKEMGGDKKVQIAAAFIILLYPGINEYRSYIIRGHGYLAFYLFSLIMFVKFIKQPLFRFAMGWGIGITIAILFRYEGFVFAMLLPLVILFKNDIPFKNRIIQLIKSQTFFWLISAAGLICVLFRPHSSITLLKKFFLLPVFLASYLQSHFFQTFIFKADMVKEHVLNKFSADYAISIAGASIIIILACEIISRLTPVFSVLTIHAIYRKCLFPVRHMKKIWLWAVFINFAILVAYITIFFLLTGRYPLALSLTIMLAVPFSLNILYEKWRTSHDQQWIKKWIFPCVCILIIIMGADSLTSLGGNNKTYLKEAGKWIKETSKPHETIFTTSYILSFYAEKENKKPLWEKSLAKPWGENWEEMLTMIDNDQWKNFDYIAIVIKRKFPHHEKEILSAIPIPPVRVFKNKKNDHVIIFKINKDKPDTTR